MDKTTVDTYNKAAKQYDVETVDFWDRFPRTFFDKFINISGQKVLDVGSGPGRDGLILQKAGKNVVCLDASEEMIKLSRERGLESVVGNFDNLPFENSSFDAVWSYTALLHIPKASIDKPLQEIHRVLKPQGIFALGMIEGDTESYKESFDTDVLRWFSYYQKEELQEMCEKHDFELVYFETFKPNVRNYLNFIFRKQL